MIALRYGTIPLVRRTGGLADTIIDIDADPGGGNGFSFETYETSELLETVRRASAHFADGRTWEKQIVRAMQSDFSWTTSIDEYLAVYERAIQKARKRSE
jgi:starch synthase